MGKEAVAASAAKSSSIATTTNSSSINSTTDTNNALTDLWRKGDFERMNGSTFSEQTILIYKPIYVTSQCASKMTVIQTHIFTDGQSNLLRSQVAKKTHE